MPFPYAGYSFVHPIYAAIIQHDVKAFDTYLRQIKAQSIQNLCILHLVIQYGHLDFFETLLKTPIIDLNAPDVNGVSPLMACILFDQWGMAARLLQNPDIAIHQVNGNNDTALLMAAKMDKPDFVSLLLLKGAHLDTLEQLPDLPEKVQKVLKPYQEKYSGRLSGILVKRKITEFKAKLAELAEIVLDWQWHPSRVF